MRRLVAVLSAIAVLTLGIAVVGSVSHRSAAPRALTCAQPFDPTVRYVVNTVCSIFGP